MEFESREDLVLHLLDRALPYCSTQQERLMATVHSARAAERLWRKYA